MNEVILIGNLGRAPELKTTTTGKSVCLLSVATTERLAGGATRTEWHRVVAWEAMGVAAHRFLDKGRSVMVKGRLATRQYVAADGSNRWVTEVVATDIRYLDRPAAPAAEEIPVAAEPEATPVPGLAHAIDDIDPF